MANEPITQERQQGFLDGLSNMDYISQLRTQIQLYHIMGEQANSGLNLGVIEEWAISAEYQRKEIEKGLRKLQKQYGSLVLNFETDLAEAQKAHKELSDKLIALRKR